MHTSPRLVGRYEYVANIGKGGFGVVDKYRDLLTGKLVAIKTIPARFVNKESRRHIREVDIMIFLHDAHPNVIGYYSMFATPCSASEDGAAASVGCMASGSTGASLCCDVDGPAYARLSRSKALLKHHGEVVEAMQRLSELNEFNLHIVMPLMSGDLMYFIEGAFGPPGGVPMATEFIEEVSVAFAFQICFGLDSLYKCNIVHRDMKPENILVRLHGANPYDSTALIADLGLARDVQPSDTFYVCTRYYRAPEIITNVSQGSPSVDVWSLGCIFYEMVTGKVLFKIDSALNERGEWEGQRASLQLEVILDIIGTPSHEDIERFMPPGNAKLYLLRSIGRSSRLNDAMRENWRLPTTQDRRNKWMDLISRCLAFFPQQRPSCEDLCRHELFREYKVFYGENVRQHTARAYEAVEIGSLKLENRRIVLDLVLKALERSSLCLETSSSDETEMSEDDCGNHFSSRKCIVSRRSSFVSRGAVSGLEHTYSTSSGACDPSPRVSEARDSVQRDVLTPISDPELRQRYYNRWSSGEAPEEIVASILMDLQLHTHDRERSEQLRFLLQHFSALS
ncbi:Protein kinase domain [Trypanosoma vivax]|nr:Protein kinase domain [Trypanosoma vivax]